MNEKRTFAVNYAKASGRKHKLYHYDGFLSFYTKEDLIYCQLFDSYKDELAAGAIKQKVMDQIISFEEFTFDDFDIRCFEEVESIKDSSNVINPRTPPSLSFIPATLVGNFTSPLQTKTKNVVKVDEMPNDMEAPEEQNRRMSSSSNGFPKYAEMVANCRESSFAPGTQRSQRIENASKFWKESVEEKAVIPREMLHQLLETYPKDPVYVAHVFDGFVLGGHGLQGLFEDEFEIVRNYMRQL